MTTHEHHNDYDTDYDYDNDNKTFILGNFSQVTMPLARTSLKSFLATARKALNNPSLLQQSSPVTFVIGNESAGNLRLTLETVLYVD
jgi:hypothetical protein